jgi:hypothetical protein
MFEVHMVCHLWDLLDGGIEETLDHLQGELGLTGVCVPVVCPPLALLRCRPDVSPRVFRTEGGVCFRPREECYKATRCRPVVAAWQKGRNVLGEVVEGCRKRGLTCRLSVCTSGAGRVASRHPDAAAKTVHGDPWPDRLCLINPDVQGLIAGLCKDLADNFSPTAIELTEFHTGRFGLSAAVCEWPFDLGPGGRALLSTCFCESCRQLGRDAPAGLDPSAAARSAEVRFERVFEAGRAMEAEPPQLLADDPPLRAHVERQWHSLAVLIRSIAAELPCGLFLYEYDDVIVTDKARHPLALEGALDDVSGLVRSMPEVTGGDFDRAVQDALTRAGPNHRVELSIAAWPMRSNRTGGSDSPSLVRTLSRAAELGVAGVTLETYGQIPGSGLTAVKQAVRFARRTQAGQRPADRARARDAK